MVGKKLQRQYISIISLILIVMFLIVVFLNFSFEPSFGVLEPKPNFSVEVGECKFDGLEQGILSFSFNITIKENSTRVPGQIIFQIIDVYKNYSFHKYKFFHGVNLTREYEFERVYQPNETLENVTFVIDNVYQNYMYLPSEYFNYQLFYCEFGEEQYRYLEYKNISIFDVLDPYCVLFFDFEHYYKDHIYALLSHRGKQCTVIPRMRP